MKDDFLQLLAKNKYFEKINRNGDIRSHSRFPRRRPEASRCSPDTLVLDSTHDLLPLWANISDRSFLNTLF